jgi:hypothetical protein
MGRAAQARVRDIIGLVRRLLDLSRGFPDDLAKCAKQPKYVQACELSREIDNKLALYRGVRRTILKRRPRFVWMRAEKGFEIHPMLEFMLVNSVLDAAERNILDRVRQCHCGKYFFGRSTQSRFCSSTCRISFWESSSERKERKREKAREYYLLHKIGVVKSSRKQGKSKQGTLKGG